MPPVTSLPRLPSFEVAWSAIPIAFLLYGLLLFDARRKDSTTAGDDQIGLKTVAATLAVVSTLLFAIGLRGFLEAILTFDDFGARLKAAMPSLLVGALGVVGTALVLFPRTNAAQYPKAKRLTAGVVALISGIAMLPALVDVLGSVVEWPSWRVVAAALATAVDAGVIFVISFAVLGKLSGMKMPEPKARPAAGPPAGPPGGYGGPPQGQPPQGYPGQPMQGQPMQGQPMQGQPMQGQPMQGQPMQGQPMPGQYPGPGGYPPQG